jgi:hypothetical protein
MKEKSEARAAFDEYCFIFSKMKLKDVWKYIWEQFVACWYMTVRLIRSKRGQIKTGKEFPG